jgi:hypothetical protein
MPITRDAQVRRFVEEVWNGRDYDAAGDLYGDDYVRSSCGSRSGAPTPAVTPAGAREAG